MSARVTGSILECVESRVISKPSIALENRIVDVTRSVCDSPAYFDLPDRVKLIVTRSVIQTNRRGRVPLRLPDACREFLDRFESQMLVELHR